jgi:hypothetical protein
MSSNWPREPRPCGVRIAEGEALKRGVEVKSKEFVEKGAEVYSKA